MRTYLPALLALASFGACTPLLEALPASEASPEPHPVVWGSQGSEGLRIPGGEKCLTWLPRLGIHYEPLDPLPSVDTPVEVHGPIAGVSYTSAGKQKVVADCRLILALDWVGPSLREFGISGVQYSGAYVNRTQRNGRPSLHARGLAIDVHAFSDGRERVEVERDFERGLDDGCDPDAPEVNRVVCRLRALNLFRELLTPDSNADHHDHVHLALAPRPEG